MEPEFWHKMWREGRTGFHEGKPNGLLTAHFDRLQLGPDARVFVPLCGKTVDLDWILAQGHRVVGIELSRSAVKEVFRRLKLVPRIEEIGAITAFRANKLDLFVGDFFDLSAETLGPVDAVYDRAALIALPAPMRTKYAARLRSISVHAGQLVISLDYDQSQMDGPPFSADDDEVERLYGRHYRLEKLIERPLSGPIGERTGGSEVALLLDKA